MSMPGPTPTGPEPSRTPGETPNPVEVPPSPALIEDPAPRPDVIDPGVGTPMPGQVPNVPGGPMVA